MVKKTLLSLAVATALTSMVGCNVSTTDKYDDKISNSGVQYTQGSSFYPIFAPEAGKVPLAIDFLFADAATSDGTANTADTTPPVTTALNKLDGFSTVAPLYIEFSEAIDADTVEAGKTVFLVKLNPKDGEALIVDDANPFNTSPITSASYEARAITLDDGRTPAIQILLKEPLAPKTKYLVVLTDAIKGANGQAIGQSVTYSHAIGSDKVMSAALAPVRTALQGWQQLAQAFLAQHPLAAGAEGNVVFNYAFTTGGTTDVLNAMAAPATFLAAQMPTYLHAEGAIRGSVEKAVRSNPALAGADEATINGHIDAGLASNLALIAQGVGQKLNMANADNPSWTALPLADGGALRDMFIGSEALRPYYYAGLITAIADGQGAGVDVAIDKPRSRAYQAIVSGPASPVAVPYDDFLTAQVTAKVNAQITSIAVGEGAITQAVIGGGGNQAAADAQLDYIAGLVATQINAENPGTLPTTDGATIRPTLKSTPALQPYYLTGLRTAITTSQVDALSSKGNIYQGGLKVPSYLADAEVGNQDAALGTWTASDAAAQALGLPGAPRDVDGVSTNVTYRFPFANKIGDNVLPVMAVLPDAASCGGVPADGWPVAIYQHGITVDRTAGVLVGNALAKACVAMVAIDHAMHGVAPGNATGLVFSVNTTHAAAAPGQPSAALSPFALARAGVAGTPLDPNNILVDLKERHNNVGKNAAQQNVAMEFAAAGAAADVGASGDLYINLQNFARTRDGMRQTVMDMLNLSASISAMDIDADGNSDFDASKVYFIGHSLGGIVGSTFVAVNNDPTVRAFNGSLAEVKAAILGNPGGGVVKLLENSPSIGGAKILPGLEAAAGLTQGSTNIEKFFGVMQAMVDSADPINFAAAPGLQNTPVLLYTAVGDLVVPNNATDNIVVDAAKSYLAGTEPLSAALGLEVVNSDTAAGPVMGSRFDIRIAEDKGTHSTFSNAEPQATFAEIYGQIGSFISEASPLKLQGINVQDTTVLEQAE